MPDRSSPVEAAGRRRRFARPEHPSGEDPVEEGLYQGRVEEARTLLALEADPERLLKRQPHRRECRRVARRLDSHESIAGVGGEQPREVLRLGERGPMRQGAGEIFAQAGAGLAGEGPRSLKPACELRVAAGETERFEGRFPAAGVRPDECELAQVRHQDQAIASPVTARLLAHPRCVGVLARRLHLDHAPLRELPLTRPALLHLLRRVKAEVGVPRALIDGLRYAEHLRLEGRADGIEQLRERAVGRSLTGCPARRAQPPKLGEPSLHRRRQLRAPRRRGHGRRSRSRSRITPRAARSRAGSGSPLPPPP